jgi:putative ABC transport system substrate-binding protein
MTRRDLPDPAPHSGEGEAHLDRRAVIASLGAGAATLFAPRVARAQQSAMPVIGFLSDAAPGPYARYLAGFRAGLAEAGFVEGQNVAIAFRWADGAHHKLPALASDLVERGVAVIVCSGGGVTVPVAMAATKTIPIVFVMGGDPVNLGYVGSLNRPGGNVTGVAQFSSALVAKQVELLRQVAVKAAMIGFLATARTADAETRLQRARAAARSLGAQIVAVEAEDDGNLARAFATLAEKGADSAVISGGAFFTSRVAQLGALAMKHRLPTIYVRREFAAAGGLMSYGTSLVDVYRQVGVYAGRVLHGTKPADLPVMQPTKFELVINRRTAKALGLEIPPMLLALADEVIE